MTIDSSIRDKVIELHKNGKKRDAIARELNIAGGSVSNILKDWRQRESNVQEHLDHPRVTTFPGELADKEFKKNPDISIENHTINNTQDFEENDYPIAPVKGSPLNWFTNGYGSEGAINNKSAKVINAPISIDTGSLASDSDGVGLKPSNENQASLAGPAPGGPVAVAPATPVGGPAPVANPTPKPEPPIDFDNKPYPEFYPNPNQVNKGTNYINNHEQQDAASKGEEEFEQPTRNSEDPPIYPRLGLGGIDWDSQAIWERKLVRAWGERSEQLRLIEDGKLQLKEEREQLESMRETVRLQINDLKVREAKVAEVELLIPLSKQLQMMKVDVRNFIPWSEMVQQYAMNHNTDLTTAAFDIKKKLEEYGELEFIKKEIKMAEAYWSALCDNIRENQRAVNDLIYLRRAGCGKRDFKRLGEVIRGQRLDEELIPKEELEAIRYRVNRKKKQSNNNNNSLQPNVKVSNLQQPSENNNGPSMSDLNYIRLHLLKGAASTMLNRIRTN